ncbi:MAG: pimeloyl-ACP methyl ester esterase BioH [Gammaproteobacteria bacterium]|jgi:pimeloyl-[acyl-carrier protein] methyl ester esterase|nr:pimeloyl-ACP methyl ester esterase BioH [Gammaproteobacteria bacterium]
MSIIDSGAGAAFLHGWGLHSGVWSGTIAALSAGPAGIKRRMLAIDLPGHGHGAPLADDYTLPALAAEVARSLPAERTVLIGWSLGGLTAMQIALDFPEKLERLVLVDSSPQFVADERWPHAMSAATLEDFSARLIADHAGTIRRFLALQVLGSEHGRETLARLKDELSSAPPPEPLALAGGLRVLRSCTLVPRLADLEIPLTMIHGERDTLVPLAAAQATVDRVPGAELRIIAGAGHAPFLSHPDRFIEALA